LGIAWEGRVDQGPGPGIALSRRQSSLLTRLGTRGMENGMPFVWSTGVERQFYREFACSGSKNHINIFTIPYGHSSQRSRNNLQYQASRSLYCTLPNPSRAVPLARIPRNYASSIGRRRSRFVCLPMQARHARVFLA
jgi:hypothetical protein